MDQAHDVPAGRLPPGQVVTRKFPVVGEKAPAAAALDPQGWRLVVAGAVAQPNEWTLDEFLALPQRDLTADIHCVTGWTHFGMRLHGVPLATLLDRAAPRDDARFVRFIAYSDREHDTSLPLDLARADSWLIHSCNGQPLTVEHGYPLRVVTPSRYFYKSLKWVHRVELLTDDQLGYWERESSYHNGADPWPGDQRFTSGSIDPAKRARFVAAVDFDPWRGRVLLGVDLREWTPRTVDLHGLQLKNCDLRGAQLAGADLSGTNLSLSDLRGADLRRAKLTGADIEGVNLIGADLRDANLDGAFLTATQFVAADGSVDAARVRGLTYHGATGLLEDQEIFLKAHA